MSLHPSEEIARRVATMGQAGHAQDCATDPMDAYCANADDAAKAWGSPDSPETKAAYILGCAQIHAAEVKAQALRYAAETLRPGLHAISGALHRRAMTEEGKAVSLSRQESALASIGEAIAAAIEVHSESIDRLADAVETRAP